MNAYSITIDLSCGTPVERVAKEAIELANKLDCFVVFDYNGVECHAHPCPIIIAPDFAKRIQLALRQGYKQAFCQ